MITAVVPLGKLPPTAMQLLDERQVTAFKPCDVEIPVVLHCMPPSFEKNAAPEYVMPDDHKAPTDMQKDFTQDTA